MEYKPTEFDRFFDPDDWIGLRSWAYPDKSKLLQRLKRIQPRDTVLDRRGLHILKEHFGNDVMRISFNDFSYGLMRLIAIDWLTQFKVLRFFQEEEVRDYARVHGPPERSVLAEYWYGLFSREEPGQIEWLVLSRRHPSLDPTVRMLTRKRFGLGKYQPERMR